MTAPTLDMPEAALKERKKAVNQVDMEDQPSWCGTIVSMLATLQTAAMCHWPMISQDVHIWLNPGRHSAALAGRPEQ